MAMYKLYFRKRKTKDGKDFFYAKTMSGTAEVWLFPYPSDGKMNQMPEAKDDPFTHKATFITRSKQRR